MTSPLTPSIYGVFLRPDPLTTMAVSTITTMVTDRLGPAGAEIFPPHIPLAAPVRLMASPGTLVQALDHVLNESTQFEVVNTGIRRTRETVTYDFSKDGANQENAELLALAVWINKAIRALTGSRSGQTHRFCAQQFQAHIPLISHSLRNPHDVMIVEAFIRRLAIPVPALFTAETVSLYEFTSNNRPGRWWESLAWTHHKTWQLGPTNP